MKNLASLLAAAALCAAAFTGTAQAEPRTFTASNGREVTAEIAAAYDGKVDLKLANGRTVTVPVDRLSADDQEFIKQWAEENFSLKPGALRLSVRKSSKAVREKEEKDADGNKKKPNKNKEEKSTEVLWNGELQNQTRETLPDVAVAFTVYKKVKKVAMETEDSETETFEKESGEERVGELEGGAKHEFETKKFVEHELREKVEGNSKVGTKAHTRELEEDIVGAVFVVTVNGKEVYRQSDPQGFEQRFAEQIQSIKGDGDDEPAAAEPEKKPEDGDKKPEKPEDGDKKKPEDGKPGDDQ